MLGVINIFVPKPEEVFVTDMHLMEHCVVEKIEKRFKKIEIENLGIVINAETFLDGFGVELLFSNLELESLLLEQALNNVCFTQNDIQMIQKNKSIITSELSNIDINEEEISLYAPLLKSTKLSIMDLYEASFNELEIGFVDLFNELWDNKSLTCSSNGLITKYRNNKLNTLNNDYNLCTGTFYTGCINYNILTVEEYIYLNFYSFILGKSSESIIDQLYLNENDLYLGYTHDVIINDSYHILFLMEHGDYTVSQTNIINVDFINIMTETQFKKQKNAFKTYFLLNNDARKINEDFSKLTNMPSEIKYKELIKQIDFLEQNRLVVLLSRLLKEIKC